MPRPPIFYVKSPKQWEVVLSPIRGEIAQALRCLGPCSAAQLAKMVDRPADTLYRHLEQLQKAGFVVEAGERKRGRHSERLYDMTADDFYMDFAQVGSGEGRETVRKTSRSFFASVGRSIEDSLDAGALEMEGNHRNFVLNYELSWLTPEKFKKARALMYQLKQLMDEARPKGEGRLYCSLSVIAPVTRSKRREVKPVAATRGARKSPRSSD